MLAVWHLEAELSGEVILRPDLAKARELAVEVTNPELMAYGRWDEVRRAFEGYPAVSGAELSLLCGFFQVVSSR